MPDETRHVPTVDDPEVEPDPNDSPGDAGGVPVPHADALENSSEQHPPVEGVHVIHPPADADGSQH